MVVPWNRQVQIILNIPPNSRHVKIVLGKTLKIVLEHRLTISRIVRDDEIYLLHVFPHVLWGDIPQVT